MRKIYFLPLFVICFLLLNISFSHPNPKITPINQNEIEIDFTGRISCSYELGIDIPFVYFGHKEFHNIDLPKKIPVNLEVHLYQQRLFKKEELIEKATIKTFKHLSSSYDKEYFYGFHTTIFNNGKTLSKGHYKIKVLINNLPEGLSSQSLWNLYPDGLSILGCFAFI